MLFEDDTRLMAVIDGEKRWADIDSPVVFLVDLDRAEIAPPGLQIYEGQVLRVEKQIEERVIEQPVLIEAPLHRLNAPLRRSASALRRRKSSACSTSSVRAGCRSLECIARMQTKSAP